MRGGDIGLPRFRERYIGRSLHSARGPRLRKDDNLYRGNSWLALRPFLSSCHPAREAQDLGKVGRAVGIGRRLLRERYIGVELRSA